MSYDYLFKYIILGDSGVGKSCIISQFIEKNLKQMYFFEFGCSRVDVKGKDIKLQIWDFPEQKPFQFKPRQYYRSSAGVILVYDITRRGTFENVGKWLEEAKSNGNSTLTFILVGNKCDLSQKREVSIEEGQKFAEANGLIFLETSAKIAINIDDVFQQSAEIIMEKINKNQIDPANDSLGIRVGQKQLVLNKPVQKEKYWWQYRCEL